MDSKLVQIRSKQQSILIKVQALKNLSNSIQLSINYFTHNIQHITHHQIKSQITNLILKFPQLFQKIVQANHQFDSYFRDIRALQEICITNKQIIEKLNKQVTKQANINKMMKAEVLQLNYLISQHVQMSKKKMIQKDQIINYLKQNMNSLEDNNSINKTDKLSDSIKKNQTAIFQQFNSKDLLEKSNKFTLQKPNLDIIHEEEQLNLSNPNSDSRASNTFKYQPTNENNQIIKEDQNLIKTLKNSNTFYEKSDPKTKTKNFIEDFRKGIQQNSYLISEIKDDNFLCESSSRESKLSIGRNDFNKITLNKNQSPKRERFIEEKNQKILLENKEKQNLNNSFIRHKNKIFSKDNNMLQKSSSIQKTPNRQRPNSKQKIHLVLKQNIQTIDTKTQPKLKLFQIDSKGIKPRPNSREKLAVTCKNNYQNNHKLKLVVGYKTINNRKNVSVITQRMIKQILQNLDLEYGEKSQQLVYQGNRINGVRVGKGRLQYSNGIVYQGQFKQNVRNGFGILSQKDKIIYEGQWERDKLCGKGTLKNINLINKKKIQKNNLMNFAYIGQFEQNKFHGTGTILISLIQKFYCTFHDGIPQGQYSFYNKQGLVEFGVWDNNLN